jgi:hypothetical protein
MPEIPECSLIFIDAMSETASTKPAFADVLFKSGQECSSRRRAVGLQTQRSLPDRPSADFCCVSDSGMHLAASVLVAHFDQDLFESLLGARGSEHKVQLSHPALRSCALCVDAARNLPSLTLVPAGAVSERIPFAISWQSIESIVLSGDHCGRTVLADRRTVGPTDRHRDWYRLRPEGLGGPVQAGVSERYPQGELDLARIVGLARNQPKRCASKRCIGWGKLDSIEKVKEFCSEIHADLFGYGSDLRRGEIPIVDALGA